MITKTIINAPYTYSSLLKRIERTKLIRYSPKHQLGGINLYLVKDVSQKIRFSNQSLFVRGSVYFTPDYPDTPFFAVWRINQSIIRFIKFKSYTKSYRAAKGAINITDELVEHTIEYERNINDVIGNYAKSWNEEYED